MFSKTIAAGRLAKEWSTRTFGTNKVAENVIACRNPKLKGKEVEYYHIKLWNKQAELAMEYTSKGSTVLVEGVLQNEKWEYEGKEYYKTVINCDTITFLDNKNTAGQHDQNEFAKVDSMFGDEEDPEDDDMFAF